MYENIDGFGPSVSPEGENNREELERINEAAARELLFQRYEVSHKIIDFVHEALTKCLKIDRKTQRRIDSEPHNPGESFDFYILEEFLAAPTVDGEHQWCFSMKLRDINRKGDPKRGNDELTLYIPFASDTDADEAEELSVTTGEVPVPEQIYIEHTNIYGEKTRYEIGDRGLRPYSAIADGQEINDWDVLEDSDLIDDGRLESNLPALYYLWQNLIDMKAVPQRRIIIGDDKVYNI